MTIKGTTAIALLAFALFALLSLLRGAPYLEAPLAGGLPLGNVLAASGLCSVAAASVALSARGTALRAAAHASLIAAAGWLPLSIALAGNLALNFRGGRGAVWMVLSLVVAIAVLCTLLWAVAASMLARRRGAGRT